MKIPDLINELFESREMSEYLIEHFAELSKYNILRMVCSAPIDIRRKAEILLELSKDENIEKEIAEELKEKDVDISEHEHIKEHIIENSFRFNCEYALKAISLLEATPGDVFSVQNLWYDEEWPTGYGEGDFHISSSFENAMKYIDEEMKLEEWSWNDKNTLSWYEIRKWSLTEDGGYKEIIRYELIDNKLMFFTYSDRAEYVRNKFNPDCNLNLITPFSTGDILTVDCRPQKPKRNVLILENVTNYDCCSLQGMFFDPKEKLFSAHAVKHGSIYRNFGLPSLTLLAKNKEGIKALQELTSNMIQDECLEACKIINIDILNKHRENLLVGSTSYNGEIFHEIKWWWECPKDYKKMAKFYDFFEVSPSSDKEYKRINERIIELSKMCDIPVIATSNARHYDQICSTEEMLEEFSYLGKKIAYDVVLKNPNAIAHRIKY